MFSIQKSRNLGVQEDGEKNHHVGIQPRPPNEKEDIAIHKVDQKCVYSDVRLLTEGFILLLLQFPVTNV